VYRQEKIFQAKTNLNLTKGKVHI